MIMDNLIEIKNETQETNGKNIIILSLKNVTDQSIKKVLPLVICKEIYDSHKELNDKTKYLNISPNNWAGFKNPTH